MILLAFRWYYLEDSSEFTYLLGEMLENLPYFCLEYYAKIANFIRLKKKNTKWKNRKNTYLCFCIPIKYGKVWNSFLNVISSSINLSFLKSKDEINGNWNLSRKHQDVSHEDIFFTKQTLLYVLGFRLSFHFYGLRKQQAAAQSSKNRCEKMQ